MSGGQATNAGISYQQRVAAWFLIHQYARFSVSLNFNGVDEDLIPVVVSYETSSSIDDLNLTCEKGRKVFVQVKTNISLSDKPESAFGKTVRQFVDEFIKSPTARDYFLLATQSSSSSKVTEDLRKLLFALRLNPHAFDDNPLSKSETETLTVFRHTFHDCYKTRTGKDSDEVLFCKFARRCVVAVLDIESGHPLEAACLVLLRSQGFKAPHLLFALLVENSLTYSAQRLSIDATKLDSTIDRYRQETETAPTFNLLDALLKEDNKFGGNGEYSVGKEVLIIHSFVETAGYMVVELHRFRDDCQIKSVFFEDKIRIISGDEWRLVQRFATFVGLERHLKSKEDFYKDKRMVLIPAKDTDEIDATPCAKLHRAHLASLIAANHHPWNCLHCAKAVNSASATVVEIEDRDTQAAVGLVHDGCMRPIDRVLGLVQIPDHQPDGLESFDFRHWARLLLKGQGMLNALKGSSGVDAGSMPLIGWSSDVEYDAEYKYCVRFTHLNGPMTFSRDRGRVQRMRKDVAEEYAEGFNRKQAEAVQNKDPLCHTSLKSTFGPYSQLIKLKGTEEELLVIEKAEVVKYSKLEAQAYDSDVTYYSPMCLVRSVEDERLLNLGNIVPLVSNPLKFSSLKSNWQSRGGNFDDWELKIIKADQDFDGYLRMFFADDMVPIIDPEFDLKGNLVKGYPFGDLNAMIAERSGKAGPREG